MNHPATQFTMVAAIAFNLGCATVSYEISAPQALPVGVPGKLEDSGYAELRLQDLTLVVAALDYATSDAKMVKYVSEFPSSRWASWVRSDVPPFMVFLAFKAKTIGFAFSPMQSVAHMIDRASLSPTAYIGPGEISWDSKTQPHQQGCAAKTGFFKQIVGGWNPLPRQASASSYALPTTPTCFVLAFDAKVEIPQVIDLAIGGITREGGPVPGVTLRFSRRPAKAKYFVYVRPSGLP